MYTDMQVTNKIWPPKVHILTMHNKSEKELCASGTPTESLLLYSDRYL